MGASRGHGVSLVERIKKEERNMPATKTPVKTVPCSHVSYAVIDGELRCSQCNELSHKAKLVNGQIVRIQPEVTCPECGHKFTVAKQ